VTMAIETSRAGASNARLGPIVSQAKPFGDARTLRFMAVLIAQTEISGQNRTKTSGKMLGHWNQSREAHQRWFGTRVRA